MEKTQIVAAIAATIGIDESLLTKALTTDEKVEIEIPKGVFIPEAEKEAYEKRISKSAYTEGKQAGTEMLIKEWKEKEGIDIEGKTMDVFVSALKNKVTTEIKAPTDEKVTRLTADLEALRNTYTTEVAQREQTIQALQGTLKSQKIDAALRAYVPAELQTLKPEQFLHVAKLEYQFDTDETGQLIVKKGDQIVTDKLQKPRPASEILTEYAAEQGWLKKGGRAGGNEPGGNGGNSEFKTMDDVYGYLYKNRIDPMGTEGQKIIQSFEETQK
jgi:hypothetical protein